MYRVINAIDGTMIMDVMNKWVSIAGVRVDRQQVVKGLVLLAAVIFDLYNQNKDQWVGACPCFSRS